MKKFYSLLTAVCVLFMVGCSDDDDDNKLERNYKDTNIEKLKLNGFDQKSEVKFTSNDLKTGLISITQLLPGEATTDVTVTMTESSTKAGEYAIKGEAVGTDRKVSVEGTAGDKLSIEVTNTITSALAGSWKPMPFDPKSETNIPTVNIKVKAKEDVKINFQGIMEIGEIPVSQLQATIAGLGGKAFTEIVDFKLDMKKTGYIVANWNPIAPLFKPGSSKDGVVAYNVIDKQVLVKLPLDIMGGVSKRETGPSLDLTSLPLNIDKATADGITVSVDKTLMTPAIMAGIKLALPLLLADLELGQAAAGMGITKESLTGFLNSAIDAINNSEEFTIEINMQSAK